MPPKRQARVTTPPSTKKQKRGVPATGNAQTSIEAFFTSPSRAAGRPANGKHPGKLNGAAKHDVISIDDSSDDEVQEVSPGLVKGVKRQVDDDEALARSLAKKWAEKDEHDDGSVTVPLDKGKGKASEDGVANEDDADIVLMEPASSEARGVNGSSTSSHLLPPVKLEPRTASNAKSPPHKPVHPMFASKRAASPTPLREVKTDIKSFSSPSKPATITTTSAEPVEPIDFDTDSFLFRPADVDVSRWPKGRLPYSVLVGVYVQVSGTRSRLTIVRVLTK
jgi:DNA ligase-1